MSHFSVLLIGDDIEGQLRMYDESIEVPRYKKYVERSHTEWPVSHATKAGIDPTDLPAVAAFLNREWEQESYAVDDIGLYEWSTYNPESKWDWYSVGGRWTGHFLLRSGATGQTGSPGLMTEPAKPGHADVACKGAIDFAGMRQEHATRAADEFDRYAALVAVNEPALSWEQVDAPSVEERRTIYWAQPLINALSKDGLLPWNGTITDTYGMGREAYIERAARRGPTTYAMVAEGAWKAKGEMGWFGCSDEPDDTEPWVDFWWRMVDGLPDDMPLTIVDCHI